MKKSPFPACLFAFLSTLFLISAAKADSSAFTLGPLITEYGPAADIEGAAPLPDSARFKVSFDTAAPAENGGLNKTLVSAARFLNMHNRSGVAPDAMNLAVVVHGKAVRDVANPIDKEENPNAALIKALTSHNVRIIVCGQSAAYYDVATKDLLPGVEMSISAMTAHARLQQDGYTLNPF